jgi:hypothetical protein
MYYGRIILYPKPSSLLPLKDSGDPVSIKQFWRFWHTQFQTTITFSDNVYNTPVKLSKISLHTKLNLSLVEAHKD